MTPWQFGEMVGVIVFPVGPVIRVAVDENENQPSSDLVLPH